jgi:hypothetical protein
MATAPRDGALLYLREEQQRVGAEVGCDLRSEGLLRQSEGASLGVLEKRRARVESSAGNSMSDSGGPGTAQKITPLGEAPAFAPERPLPTA